MSRAITPTLALDHALAQLHDVQGVPILLAGDLAVDHTSLAARLTKSGAAVRTRPADGPCYVLGAGDEDLTGHLGATSRTAIKAPRVPTIDLSGSPLMRLAHDHIGIGQTSVLALLDITNLQLAGRSVVVCGYGAVGAGVAAHVAAFGGRVTVVEADGIRAVQALMAGHSVNRIAQALSRAEVVFVTDEGPYLGGGDHKHLSSDTIICAAGVGAAISPEIVAFGGDLRAVRAHVQAFDLPHARDLKLIAGGRPLHVSEGQGVPLEAQDIVLALHILALNQLLQSAETSPVSSPLDPLKEAALAEVVARSMGGMLEGKS